MRIGPDLCGNVYDRRARKNWLLSKFGNGRRCPCEWCGKSLTFKTVTADRVVRGVDGGRYVRPNLVPACRQCNCGQRGLKVRRVPRVFGDYTTREFRALVAGR